MSTKKDPYKLDPAFERALVTLCCARQRFYGRIGHALEPALLGSPEGKLALEAAHAIRRESGSGPSALLFVSQRLRRWHVDGRVTMEQIQAVNSYFDAAEDAGLPEEEPMVAEVLPMLQARIRKEATMSAIEDVGKGGDLSKSVKLAQSADRLGLADDGTGIVLGEGSFEAIEQFKKVEKLPLGIPELDIALGGGAWRGSLNMFLGASGDGKSMGLSHVFCEGLINGCFGCYATLELPVDLVLARIKANLTGLPIDGIMEIPEIQDECKRRLAHLRAQGFFGYAIVKQFTPHATTCEDIFAWVAACEEQVGRKIDLLVTDYADKLAGSLSKSEKDQHGYNEGRVVYEGLRVHADERRYWSWTASQATRNKEKKQKNLTLDDTADSMHKIRVADLVVSLNARDDGASIVFGVPKNRRGKRSVSVGPLPVEFERARICPVVRPAALPW